MIKNAYKILALILIAITIIMIFPINYSEAFTNPIYAPDAYKPDKNIESNNTEFTKIDGTIIQIFQYIGTFAMVFTIMIIGIRYMIASTEDKASYKETMIPYLIGAIMVFAIPQIVRIIYDLVTGAFFV